jgi:GMP synthase-like glutamine amidotransferase
MSDRKPRLAFLGQMGQPGRYDPATFARVEGGDDERIWFDRTLERAGIRHAVEYDGRRVCHGDPLPPLSGEGAPDAVVIGGSFHSVHDGHPWQRDLIEWLQAARERGDRAPPVFGICGGHQLMALALGAPVDMLPGGTLAATHPVTLTDAGRGHPLFADMPDPPAFHFGNEEQVSVPPEGAEVLARLPGMPIAALDYGGGWYSVQFHPEAPADDFAEGWRTSHPEYMKNYTEVPEAPLIFRNFLRLEKVLT